LKILPLSGLPFSAPKSAPYDIRAVVSGLLGFFS